MLLVDFLDQLGLRHLHLHFCLLPVDSVQRTVFCNSARNAASAIIFTASFKPHSAPVWDTAPTATVAMVAMVDTAEMMTTTDGAKGIPFRSYILNTKKTVDWPPFS